MTNNVVSTPEYMIKNRLGAAASGVPLGGGGGGSIELSLVALFLSKGRLSSQQLKLYL